MRGAALAGALCLLAAGGCGEDPTTTFTLGVLDAQDGAGAGGGDVPAGQDAAAGLDAAAGGDAQDAAPADTAPAPDTSPDAAPEIAPDAEGDAGLPCAGDEGCVDPATCRFGACAGGACSFEGASQGCRIDGACVAAGASDPADACRRCDPAVDLEGWSAVDCYDGDPCTGPDTCAAGVCQHPPVVCPEDDNPCTVAKCVGNGCGQAATGAIACADPSLCVPSGTCQAGVCKGPKPPEVCGDGIDNDCDGQTDGSPPACSALGQPCSFHAECNPEGVCAHHGSLDAKVCSLPCAGAADCPAGQICTRLAGGAQIGFCEPPVGPNADGQPCETSDDCQTRSCVDGVCRRTCLHQGACTKPGEVCSLVGTAAFLSGVCRPAGGLTPAGQSCELIPGLGLPDPSFCASGFCDELSPGFGCSNLCRTRADCGPKQACNLVAIAQDVSPATTAFSAAVPGPFHAGAFACFTPPSPPGTAADGTVCTQDGDCESSHCLALLPGDATRFCTRFCTTDAQCAPSMICRMDALDAESPWMTAAGTAGSGKQTLVRICRFP